MIQTRPRTRWVIQMSLMTVLCAVFGVWGWYDYSVKIPMDELGYQKQVAFTNVKSGLEAHANGEDNALQTAVQAVQAARQQLSESMTKGEIEELKSVRQEMESQFKLELQRAQDEGLVSVEFNYTAELGTVAQARLRWSLEIDRLAAGLLAVGQGRWARGSDSFANFVEGVSNGITAYQKFPVPNKWNRMVQWLFILCGPYSVVAGLQLIGGLRKKYSVDDEGNFHHPQGSWGATEISDIDMSRWMSKSVAKIVHADGRAVKVDDYVHQDADQIIGAIAHRLRPEEWTDHAKAVEAGSTSEEVNIPSDTPKQD
jgi:hypothetical protein